MEIFSHFAARRLLLALVILGNACPVFSAGMKILVGHVPEPARYLTAAGRLASTNELHLAIGVPLRNSAGLDHFLTELSDPASPNYRQYLTLEEFTARFSATTADYAAVKNFALANGLHITAEHANRLVLDVSGSAAAVEKTFRIKLQTYRHPTEARDFFAPDAEPVVESALPVADVQGLSDFYRPHPMLRKMKISVALPKNGSAPDGSGSYFGNDFRNAYAPGVTLTGAGQMVGLMQFDGFYSNDIAAYATAAGGGRASIPIQTVLLDGYNGVPTTGANSGNGEVSLDIEMAMSMAPGLAKIVVFEAGPSGLQNDVLNSMVSYSATVKNLSSSWGWGGGPSTTTDNIFKNMQAGGQTFFNASGDSDAFTTGASSANGVDNTSLQNAPSSCPYITQVGGTTLTMNGTGVSYTSETAWNWGYDSIAGGYVGTSGGISSYYSIPSWQTNISNLAGRGGSTSFRNIPDVALTADNVYVVSGGSAVGSGGTGGTSCAAPLWAGFIALVNQQAAAVGKAPVGFINPAIYNLAAGSSYANCFHDITTGNNFWSTSPSLFSATSGYDLCTGLGTPNGQNLISALAGSSDTLAISPFQGYSLNGPLAGPFNPSAGVFQLTNVSNAALTWSLTVTSTWLHAAFTNGALAGGASTNLSVNLAAAANSLPVGNYATTLRFTNLISHVSQSLPFTLQVLQPLSVSPVKGFTATGPLGGAFVGGSQDFILTNLSGSAMNWSLIKTSAWLSVTASNGTLNAGSQATVTVGLATMANTLTAAVYSASIVFSNASGVFAVVPFTLLVGQPLVQNGGFETGDFTGWTQSGNTAYTSVITTSTYVHGGIYGAQFGPSGSPGYISQNVPTIAGQNYLLSVWVRNVAGSTPNLFLMQWDGNLVAGLTNFTTTTWTNFQRLVTASTTSTPLQLGLQDDPSYLAVDDISVTPITTTFRSTLKVTNNFKLVFDTTGGLKYQVQYKTNILQANWINLGNLITATTNSLTVTDTNTASSLQRFYRLLVTQ